MHAKPKKSLGQNFLTDKNIQNKIINACALRPCDIVLEIGAGRGEMTKLIAPRVAYVYALEIDSNLCADLKENLQAFSNLKIINKDILKFNLPTFFKKLENKIRVIGNIPYYITTPIIGRLLDCRQIIADIHITVQRELAARIIALPNSKDYGSFSCFVQYYANPEVIFSIKYTSFFPQPKVGSCLLRLRPQDVSPLAVRDEKLFFSIVRLAFNKRRKILTNSLKGLIPRQKLEGFFKSYNINPKIRPEDLSLQDFANLSNS